jgi:hypothetical protein
MASRPEQDGPGDAPMMNPTLSRLTGFLALSLSITAVAAENANIVPEHLGIEAGVDTFYGYNFNRPSDGTSFPVGLGSIAKRSNEFGLNLATLGVVLEPSPVGFKFLIGMGSSMEILHESENRGTAIGLDPFRFLLQASLTTAATDWLALEAGIFPSYLGLESFQSQRNWNYTHGYMSDLTPYLEQGAKAALQISDSLTGELHVMNGWQSIGDFNGEPAVGTALVWTQPRGHIRFNTFFGREPSGGEQQLRMFGELVGRWLFIPPLQVAAAVDGAIQLRREGDSPAHWWAAGTIVRYALTKKLALAVRGERFDDADGAVSGTAQILAEITGTLEFAPTDSLLVKLEARHDWANRDVFSAELLDSLPNFTNAQSLVLLGVTVYKE